MIDHTKCETITKKVKTDKICYYCKKLLECHHIITENETRITAEYKCHHCKLVWYENID